MFRRVEIPASSLSDNNTFFVLNPIDEADEDVLDDDDDDETR